MLKYFFIRIIFAGGHGLHHMSRVLRPTTELETCYDDDGGGGDQDGVSGDDPVPCPVWPEHPGPVNGWYGGGQQPDGINNRMMNRCFEIRHQSGALVSSETVQSPTTRSGLQHSSCPAVTIKMEQEESDTDHELLDSLDHEEEEVEGKRREDMDRVIAELTSALIQSKGVSALTNAVNKNNDKPEKKHDQVAKKTNNLLNTKHPQTQSRNDQRSRHQNIKKTHNQYLQRKPKILVKQRCYDNSAYSSEETTESSVSVRDKQDRRQLRSKHHQPPPDILHPAFLPQVKNYQNYFHDRNISVPHSGSWHLATRPNHRSLLGDLDYKNYNYNVGMFLAEELHRANVYSSSKDYIRKKRRKRCFKSFCKFFCFFILFVSFILVIVCVSVFIIKDKYNE